AASVDRMAFIALSECSGSGDDYSGILRSYQAAADFADTDSEAIRQSVANIVALGEMDIIEQDDGSIRWMIPALVPVEHPEHEEARSKPKKLAPSEVVYVIGSTASPLVKIGRSVDVDTRLRSIQNMSPAPLTVLWTTRGGRELEAQLHAAFAKYRVHGEWFNFGTNDPVNLISAEVASRA